MAASRALAFFAAYVAAAAAMLPARAQTLEHAVKATYLHKIAAFVDWPAASFDAADSPLVLCIAGNDPVGKLADEAVSGRMYAMRRIDVRRITQPSATAGCHLLYVAGLRDDAIAAYLESVRDKPVLTITDGSADRRTRGVVNFVLRDNRVRFEVDLDTAAAHHLVVSSKLAAVAARVMPVP